MVQTEQENYKRAKARQDDLTAQVTQLKAAAVNDSAAMVKLRELNRQVEASRQIYESFLLRSRETGEQENIRSSSARIISKAVPIEEKAGPMRKAMVALGAVVGAGVGIIFALIPLVFAAFRHIRVDESGQSSTTSAVGGRPEAPQVVGDLYSSQPVSTQPDGQMPLPGLGPQRGPATAAPMGSAPQQQNAPQMYYENWRQ